MKNSEWIVEMANGPALRVALPPVMLPTGALATECRIFAAGEWLRIMRHDGGAFTKEEVRALQGLPRAPAPWVEAPPPAMSNEPHLDPFPGG